jgi:cyclic nucleotide gated channel
VTWYLILKKKHPDVQRKPYFNGNLWCQIESGLLIILTFRILIFSVVFVLSRFQDWRSEQSVSVASDRVVSERGHNVFGLLKDRTAGAFSFLGNTSHSETLNKSASEERKHKTRVLDPQGPFLQRWNKIFVVSCLVAVFVDPLFLYIPVINGEKNCLYLDKKLATTASILRFFTDIFYLLHMMFQFRTGFIAPSSRVFGRGVLVENTFAIAKRYMSTFFLVDFLAVLPLPQVHVIPST